MVGSACRTSCCDTSPALISHSDRNGHSAAGQLIRCSCEYTRHNQILIHEKSRAPVPTQSFHVSTSPLKTGDLALACHSHLHQWVHSAPLPGEMVGQVLAVMACPATLESPQPSLCPNICNLNLQVSLNSLTFKVQSKLKPRIPTKRNRK